MSGEEHSENVYLGKGLACQHSYAAGSCHTHLRGHSDKQTVLHQANYVIEPLR